MMAPLWAAHGGLLNDARPHRYSQIVDGPATRGVTTNVTSQQPLLNRSPGGPGASNPACGARRLPAESLAASRYARAAWWYRPPAAAHRRGAGDRDRAALRWGRAPCRATGPRS